MSRLLVSLQFLFIALIAWPFQSPRIDVFNAGLFGGGLLVFVFACAAMGGKTFTVMPEPRRNGELATAGIYGVVRHPMYLAVLLCAAGAALAYGDVWKWALAGLLAVVLWFKLTREERFLLQRYPDYAAYRARTKALVPWLL